MSGRKRKIGRKERSRGARRSFAVFLALIAAIGAFFGWMSFCARSCHLCAAEVCLADLPEEMDGVSLLFLTDTHLKSERDAQNAAALLAKFAALKPDILLLGGDYQAQSAMELLNSADAQTDRTESFRKAISDFPAPLGKYAVFGEKDSEAFSFLLADAGVNCLRDSAARIEKDGAALYLAGLGDYSLRETLFTKIASRFSQDDCVIAVSHDPAAYAAIRTAEADDGGAWADLVLSGHTLGGQIWLFGRSVRGGREDRLALSGWQHVNDVPLLISQGLGCEGAQLRLGSRCEVWLITLRKGSQQDTHRNTLL